MKLFDETFSLIERSMDLQFRRHALLSGNIANSDTPNYKARDLDFANELKSIIGRDESDMKKTNPMHLGVSPETGAHAIVDNSGAMGADGNNVDLDIAVAKMSDNSRSYSGATSWLGVQLRLLKTAAKGRVGG